MRVRVLCLVSLALALGGCEPVRIGLTVHSPNRVDATLTATVGAADRELAEATLRRLAPGKWDLDATPGADSVRLELERTFDPKVDPEIKVTRTEGGFPWVRHATTVAGEFTLPALQPEHLLSKVLADIPLELSVVLPGRVTQVKGGKAHGGTALFATKLSELEGKKMAFEATAVGWRRGAVGAWGVILLVMLWVLWPWIMPPPEVRARRREAAAQRAAQRAAVRQARAASQAERDAKNAEKAAKRAEVAAARAEKDAAKAAKRAEKDAARQVAKQADEAKAVAEADAAVEQVAEVAQPTRRRGLFGRRKGQAEPVAEPVADVVAEPIAEPVADVVVEPTPEPEIVDEPEPRAVEPEAPAGDGGEPSP
ncbi:MAG: hypothetical protein HZB16_01720 [Armatimonadetes bacterium]|nr:hypothetical protein [Armatimonadota bacterium]